jgi:hypothetical protein
MNTENISRNGILISWRGDDPALPSPNVGQIFTIEVELPANHGFGQKCIHCQGTVARVCDPGSPAPRIALRLNYMDFRSMQDGLPVPAAIQPVLGSWAG